MPAAHNIYAEQLSELGRGHALYYPEPRPEGEIEIGDVGYTRQGAFFRLFNISRPADDPVQRFGVPDGFVQLDMGIIDTFPAALEPGPLQSKSISDVSGEIGTLGEMLPAEVTFRFKCASKRGAILMLETQMIRQVAVQHRRLEIYLLQHCDAWHTFARSNDIHIGFGDLMLVTECSKTAAWSSAVYSNSSTEFGLSFSVGAPFITGGIAASSSLAQIGPLERRRSQHRVQPQGSPLPKDHTVFIQAYRLGMRQAYYHSLVFLFMKSRGENFRGNQNVPDTNEVGLQAVSTVEPQHRHGPQSPGSSELLVMRPYKPDFHPSSALLGLAMERNDGSECAVVHDSLWCSASPDPKESQIINEYKNFYFSEKGYTTNDTFLEFASRQPPNLAMDVEGSSRSSPSGSILDRELHLGDGRIQSIMAPLSLTEEEKRPYKDLTGRVKKLDQGRFASGGSSEIFKGVLTETNELVAIKVPHVDDQQTLKRLNRMSRIWQMLDHENVLRFLGLCNDLGQPFALISPLCEAGDVLQYLQTHPEANRPLMIFGIAKGLKYLHSNNVIHGDLEPSNIWINGNGRPLLSGFGQSRILDSPEFNEFLGATRYIAPELVGPERAVTTKRTDIYSFGLVGLEMLTGQVPFHRIRHGPSIINAISKGKNPAPTKVIIPPEYASIWSVLENCWTRDPESRPSMDVVVRQLPFD